jgi:hypothetical protein
VTTPARELHRALLAAVDASGADTFDRAAFVDRLEPTIGVVARTLLARMGPLPDGELAARQAVDQSLLTLERARLAETIEFNRAQMAEAEAAGNEAEVDGLQRVVLELQRRRLELDRAVADTSLLAQRRIRPTHDQPISEVTHGD